METLSTEARVGVFVLAALGIMAAFILALGDFRVSSGFTLFADFAYAANLTPGAPVRVSGIRVGRVRAVRLLTPAAEPASAASNLRLGQRAAPIVRAELELDSSVRPYLTDGTQVAVGMQGIVGDAYLELAPGKAGAGALAEGSALRGVDAPALNALVLQISGLVDILSTFSQGDLGEAGAGLARLLDTVNGILGERRVEVSRALGDLAASAADLRAVLAEARSALGHHELTTVVGDAGAAAATLRSELPALLAEARTAVGRLSALSAAAEKAAPGPELEAIVAGAKEATSNLAQLTRDARAILASVERGEGTLGGLYKDPGIYRDIAKLVTELEKHPWKLLWRD
jgi:phospholipid/cholesterol/gamma-HCH transport system substrate-binding protein